MMNQKRKFSAAAVMDVVEGARREGHKSKLTPLFRGGAADGENRQWTTTTPITPATNNGKPIIAVDGDVDSDEIVVDTEEVIEIIERVADVLPSWNEPIGKNLFASLRRQLKNRPQMEKNPFFGGPEAIAAMFPERIVETGTSTKTTLIENRGVGPSTSAAAAATNFSLNISPATASSEGK